MSASRWLLAIAAITGAALLGIWIHANVERVEVEVERGFRGEARTNPLLAAERLARELGATARSVRGFPALDARIATVVWTASRTYLSPHQHQRLLDWVDAGGTLVVEANEACRCGRDALFGGLGVTVVEGEAGDGVVTTADGLEVQLARPDWALEVPASATVLAEDALGVRLAVLPRGAGRVVVMSDAGPLRNAGIGDRDNALLFWRLARPTRPGELVLVYAETPPSLWKLAAARAPAVLAAALVALAAWLWATSRRFGPLLPEPPAGRRRLMEHIEASGRLMWREGAGAKLLDDVRASLLRTLDHRHPGWQQAPDLARRLSESSGLPVAEVEAALSGGGGGDPASFTRTVWACETLRRSL